MPTSKAKNVKRKHRQAKERRERQKKASLSKKKG